MRTTITIMMTIIALLFATAALAADEISGTFQIKENDKVIGAEKFSITFEDDGRVVTESQGTLKQGEDEEYKDYSRLQMRGLSGPAHNYQREILLNNLPRELGLTYESDEMLIEVREGVTKKDKRLRVTPATLILDIGIWHHYHLLIHRYSHRTGGEQSFMAVIPSELRLVEDVKIRHLGWEAVALENGYFMAHRYFVDRSDMGLIIWADKQGQILKIEVPMLNLIIERTKYDGERASEVNPVKVIGGDLITEAVTFDSGGASLAGVVTKPKSLEGRLPAILFLSTAGPQDRDGNSPIANVNIGTQKMMDAVSKAGFLVLRLDDRGVGESQGDIARASLSVQALDAVAALEFLKQRADVDPARLAIVGHGEGANVAIMVAAKRPDLKALALLAPCDVPLAQLAEEQIKHRLELDGNTDPEAWHRNPIAVLMSRAKTQPDLEFTVMGGRSVYLDVYREWFDMQPVEDLKKSTAKILHVQPGKDLQVFAQHAEGFRKALGGQANYTFKNFPRLNHFFKPSRGTVAEYSDPSLEVAPEFIQYLTTWLRANL
ncbi:MAG TPA: alpha/beta hydrolase [bacterium]|nr:alpha/beta hydrolase [bacterium]